MAPCSCSPIAGRAVTIATRYAAVRRQTTAKLGEPELQVGSYWLACVCVAGRLPCGGKSLCACVEDGG